MYVQHTLKLITDSPSILYCTKCIACVKMFLTTNILFNQRKIYKIEQTTFINVMNNNSKDNRIHLIIMFHSFISIIKFVKIHKFFQTYHMYYMLICPPNLGPPFRGLPISVS